MKTSGILCTREGTIWLSFSNGALQDGTWLADYDLREMPREAVELFERYEQAVNHQEFSLIPAIETKLDGYGLCVFWDGETHGVPAEDVQLASGKLSFLAQ